MNKQSQPPDIPDDYEIRILELTEHDFLPIIKAIIKSTVISGSEFFATGYELGERESVVLFLRK